MLRAVQLDVNSLGRVTPPDGRARRRVRAGRGRVEDGRNLARRGCHHRHARAWPLSGNGAGHMSTSSNVKVSAWIRIGARTKIDYFVSDDGQIEFSIGGRDGFDLVTTEQGLQNLLVHLEEALRAARGAITRNDEDSATNDVPCT
jgi:hypothetical protein